MTESRTTIILIPTVNEPTLQTVVSQVKLQALDSTIFLLGFGPARQVAENLGVSFYDLGEKTSKPRALNRAISTIKADRYIILDADAIPEEGWYQNMIFAFEEGAEIFCGSINLAMGNFWMRVYNLSSAHEFSSEKPTSLRKHLAACTMGFTREFFSENGPFSEEISRSEDFEWTLRAFTSGHELRFVPSAVVDHLPPAKASFRKVLGVFFNSGYDNWLVRIKYSKVLNTPIVLRSPYLIVLLAPLLACIPTLRIFRTSPKIIFAKMHMLPFIYMTKVAWCFGVFWGYWDSKRKYGGSHV